MLKKLRGIIGETEEEIIWENQENTQRVSVTSVRVWGRGGIPSRGFNPGPHEFEEGVVEFYRNVPRDSQYRV